MLPLETRTELDGSLDGVQLVTTADVDAGTARVGAYVTWAAWHAQASGGPLAYSVGLDVQVSDGRPVCTRLTLDQVQDGQPVTAAGMRLPVDRLVRESAHSLLTPADDEGHPVTLAMAAWAGDGYRQAWAATEPRRQPRRAPGAELDDDRRATLRRVLEEARTARTQAKPRAGEPMTQAAQRLAMSRSAFYRALQDARAADAAGLLHDDSETSDDATVAPARKTRKAKR